MRLIVGDECGILKECIPELARNTKYEDIIDKKVSITKNVGTSRINRHDQQARKNGIVSLAWIQPQDDDSFASLSVGGGLKIWKRSIVEERSYASYQELSYISDIFTEDKIDPQTKPLGLELLSRQDANILCSCNASGKIVMVDTDKQKVVESFSPLKPNTDPALASHPTLTCMSTNENRIAIGGRQRDVMLFDLATKQQVWKAKNFPPDPQTLLQPLVWPTSISFLQRTNNQEENIIAVGTAHKQVRIYDVRMDAGGQRRPIAATPNGMLEHRVTTLVGLSENTFVAADAAGYLHIIDWRKLDKNVKRREDSNTEGRYVGPAGSVRSMAVHNDGSLAAVGLDRMLRVYDNNRSLKSCMYLQQRLNCCLFGSDPKWVDEGDIEQEDIVEDIVTESEGEESDDGFARGRLPKAGSDQELSESESEGGGSQSVGSSSEEDDDEDDDLSDVQPTKRRRK